MIEHKIIIAATYVMTGKFVGFKSCITCLISCANGERVEGEGVEVKVRAWEWD